MINSPSAKPHIHILRILIYFHSGSNLNSLALKAFVRKFAGFALHHIKKLSSLFI